MLQITPLPALADNYIWVLAQQGRSIVVDPAESAVVEAFLAKQQLELAAIWLTHNHQDHTAGVAGLVAHRPNLPVYGNAEVADFRNQAIDAGEQFVCEGLKVEVLNSAGHTAGHISFLVENQHLFCGDSLFSGGCGRVFTGDYAAQFDTLQRFKTLSNEVIVYPAHEYTQANLNFAAKVMPASCELLEWQERVDILRRENRPSLPTTIGREKQINPFLKAVNLDAFIALRKQRDKA